MRLHHHLKFWFKQSIRLNPAPRIVTNTNEKTRIEHYCSPCTENIHNSVSVNSISKFRGTGYAYDWYQIFSSKDKRKCAVKFGDVIDHFDQPTFTKSRPILERKNNNILLPLDSIRHFKFFNDSTNYFSKKDNAVWRGAAYFEHRKRFLAACTNISHLDVADTSKRENDPNLLKPSNYLTISEQLQSKFIFAIEGYDVASNLKWIMGSNSIPIMPKPKFESWFCESTLIPGEHYIEIASDFSNIEQIIDDYLSKPKLCKEISENGKVYAACYSSPKRQYSIAREVAERYFEIVNTIY